MKTVFRYLGAIVFCLLVWGPTDSAFATPRVFYLTAKVTKGKLAYAFVGPSTYRESKTRPTVGSSRVYTIQGSGVTQVDNPFAISDLGILQNLPPFGKCLRYVCQEGNDSCELSGQVTCPGAGVSITQVRPCEDCVSEGFSNPSPFDP